MNRVQYFIRNIIFNNKIKNHQIAMNVSKQSTIQSNDVKLQMRSCYPIKPITNTYSGHSGFSQTNRSLCTSSIRMTSSRPLDKNDNPNKMIKYGSLSLGCGGAGGGGNGGSGLIMTIVFGSIFGYYAFEKHKRHFIFLVNRI